MKNSLEERALLYAQKRQNFIKVRGVIDVGGLKNDLVAFARSERKRQRERDAEIIKAMKQFRLPEPLRGCDFLPDEDDEGWVPIDKHTLNLLNGIAAAILADEEEA